jgi:hypothetical protein
MGAGGPREVGPHPAFAHQPHWMQKCTAPPLVWPQGRDRPYHQNPAVPVPQKLGPQVPKGQWLRAWEGLELEGRGQLGTRCSGSELHSTVR